MILPKGNAAGITTLADVVNESAQIAVGQASVPIGKYTDKVLTAIAADPTYGAAYKTTVQAKSVYLQNVAAIDGAVAFGGVDAGSVYDSDYKQLTGYGVTRIVIPRSTRRTRCRPIRSRAPRTRHIRSWRRRRELRHEQARREDPQGVGLPPMTGRVVAKEAAQQAVEVEVAGTNSMGNHVTGTVRVALAQG